MNSQAYVLPLQQRERLEKWLNRAFIKGVDITFSQKLNLFELGSVKTFLEDQNPNFKDYDVSEQNKQVRQECKKVENFNLFLKRLIKTKGVIGFTLQEIDRIWKENYQYADSNAEFKDGFINYLENHASEVLK